MSLPSPKIDRFAALETSEKRENKRQRFYWNEATEALVTTRNGEARGRIIDVDMRGVGVFVPQSANWDPFVLGEDVEVVVVTPSGEKSLPLSGVIRHRQPATTELGQFLRLGIEFLANTTSAIQISKSLGFAVHECPVHFRPLAFFSHPLVFGEVIHLQIVSVSPNGLQATTSLRNKGLFPGLAIALNVYIPTRGEFRAAARIVKVATEQNDTLAITITFVEPPGELLASLAEYLLTFKSDISVETLHKQRFFIDSIFNAIRIRNINSNRDWEAVLDLRKRAYHSVGKMLTKHTAEELSDPFDKYARHIVAESGGRIVGAARIVFSGTDLEKSEHHALNVLIPNYLKESGFVEFSRFCTDPSFRGGDVFIALIRQASVVAASSGYPYILANANPDLLKVYRKLGFKRTGIEFEGFGRRDCQLIINHTETTARGGLVSDFFTWNVVLYPVFAFSRSLYRYGLIARTWHKIHGLFHRKILSMRTQRRLDASRRDQ